MARWHVMRVTIVWLGGQSPRCCLIAEACDTPWTLLDRLSTGDMEVSQSNWMPRNRSHCCFFSLVYSLFLFPDHKFIQHNNLSNFSEVVDHVHNQTCPKLEFGCYPASTFSGHGHSARQLASLGFPSGESCRLLTLQTSGP